MKRRHFEALRPLCPVCLSHESRYELKLGQVANEHSGEIREGVLVCSNSNCQREYPIIDGIPVLVSNIRDYITQNVFAITSRDDLSDLTESLIGDACGPGSQFDVLRQHLSSYAWDHYADLNPNEPINNPRPGAVVTALNDGLTAAGELSDGPFIDLGCSVGRTTFEWAARQKQLVLGVDLNFSMLRCAARALRDGWIRYPLRRVGLVYDRQEFRVRFPNSELVDFWACDVTALPFADRSFGAAVALNLLDCIPAPMELLRTLGRVVKVGGKAILTCPYDWSPSATPVECWLGGHSQRGPLKGRSESVICQMMESPRLEACRMRMLDSAEAPLWHVRLHDRSTIVYRNHRLIFEVA